MCSFKLHDIFGLLGTTSLGTLASRETKPDAEVIGQLRDTGGDWSVFVHPSAVARTEMTLEPLLLLMRPRITNSVLPYSSGTGILGE